MHPADSAATHTEWEEVMKLYEWDFAPNCRRVRMFLAGKGNRDSKGGVHYSGNRPSKRSFYLKVRACHGADARTERRLSDR